MNDPRFPDCRIHPTALIEDDVQMGEGCAIWDNVHIRFGTRIGTRCIIGEKTYLAYDVRIGNFCKLNASVYICTGVHIDDDVMISAHTVFTNDLFPRAFDRVPGDLASSEPSEETLTCRVGKGVTIGANATIGPGLSLKDYCMIGMGSVVTRDVPPFGLVVGNPARMVGHVCICGPVVVRASTWEKDEPGHRYECNRCGRIYGRSAEGIELLKDITSV